MSSLVQELQAEALDSTKPVTDLLRKALVVAKMPYHNYILLLKEVK